ncbi:MAG: nucleotide-binding universal stress UspA family protein [Crocinitomix sp.]|jgi:nucleotide-binding universal stress UspA family protein
MEPTILVPTDFSDAANTALRHAIQTALSSKAKLNVVHFCASKDDIVSAKKKLTEWIESIDNETPINAIVRVGSFKDISDMSKESGAELIFMGTHGAKGLQKVLGSNALKLVTNSQIPYVIVQKNTKIPEDGGFKTILATASHNRESKQKIKAVIAIAKYFNSHVILLYKDEKDESLRIDTATNLVFMKKQLDQAGIAYSIKLSKGKNFNEDTINTSVKYNVDLITIMNMQMNTILGTGLLGPNYEQELLMNKENIPIMIVSPTLNSLLGNVTMM